MILPIIFPIVSSDAAVTALIGTTPTRFYPHGRAPQKVVAPYCTWFLVSGIPENVLDEVPRVDRFSVQIDCWSDNTGEGSQQVRALAEAVRDCLEPHAHMTAIVLDGVDPDTQRNRIGLQFTVWQSRGGDTQDDEEDSSSIDDPILEAALAVVQTGVNGAIYDPSQLWSLWLDSARTLPAFVNGPVGAMDDLSGNGHHALQPTTASKPFLRGTPQGAELLTGGDFASDAGWTAGAGWAIGSGVATATTASAALERADLAGVNGALYEVSYTITRSAGSVTPNIGGVAGAARSAAGRYSDWITATGTGTFQFTCSGFTGTVDNVTVKRAEAANVAGPYFLYADGTNDCMQAAAIDLSAVDKAYLCFAAQINSGTLGIVAEFATASVSANNGSFNGYFGNSSSNAAWTLRGATSISGRQTTAYTIPKKGVFGCQFDLAGANVAAEVVPRVDGATPAFGANIGTADDDGGNLGNWVLNLFSRAGASFFYSGRFYGLVLVARSTVLTASEVAMVEQYMAARSGVVLA